MGDFEEIYSSVYDTNRYYDDPLSVDPKLKKFHNFVTIELDSPEEMKCKLCEICKISSFIHGDSLEEIVKKLEINEECIEACEDCNIYIKKKTRAILKRIIS